MPNRKGTKSIYFLFTTQNVTSTQNRHCLLPSYTSHYLYLAISRTAGFTAQERTAFSRILTGSPDYRAAVPKQPLMVDAWRHLHPDVVGRFTYYSYRFQCRTKGIGWRVDYFVVSPKLLDRIVACEIRDECYGASDHIPLVCIVKGGL